MSKPKLNILSPHNWATLFTGKSGAHLKLDSSSTYTVKNAAGVELKINGVKLKSSNFFGLRVLSGGTITGFDIFKNGKRIAAGSDYDLNGSSFYNAVFRYLLSGTKTALFDLFLNAGESINGSWKSIESGLASFQLYKNIARIQLTSGKANVSTSMFAADKAALNKIVGGFHVYGTVNEVMKELAALDKDVKFIDSVAIIKSKTSKVKVSTATFSSERAALDKIVGGFQVFGAASLVEAKLAGLTDDAKRISAIAVTKGKLKVGMSVFDKDKAILDKVIGGFSIRDSAAHLKGKLAALEADVKAIDSVSLTAGRITVSVAELKSDKAILNKFVGGFKVAATLKAIESDFASLAWEADHRHIASLDILGKGTPTFHLTSRQAKAGAKLLKAIDGRYIVEVHASSGTVTSAHGDHLVIDDLKGRDTIWANGSNDRFIFASGFGDASVSGVDRHLSGKTHDIFAVQSSEFANFTALLHDAHKSGHAVVIDGKHGDKLTLDNVTMAELRHAKSDFAFV